MDSRRANRRRRNSGQREDEMREKEKEPERRVRIQIKNRDFCGENGSEGDRESQLGREAEGTVRNVKNEEEDASVITRAGIMIDQANSTAEILENALGAVGRYQFRTGNSTKTSQAMKEIDRLIGKAYGIGKTAEGARELIKKNSEREAEETAMARMEYAENQLSNLLATVNLLEVIGELKN